MVYVVMHTTVGMDYIIAALISPTPRLLWRRGVGKWPDCHVLDARSAPGLAKGCTVGALRQPVAHPPHPLAEGGRPVECVVVCMSAVNWMWCSRFIIVETEVGLSRQGS